MIPPSGMKMFAFERLADTFQLLGIMGRVEDTSRRHDGIRILYPCLSASQIQKLHTVHLALMIPLCFDDFGVEADMAIDIVLCRQAFPVRFEVRLIYVRSVPIRVEI